MPRTPEGRLLDAATARLKTLAASDPSFVWRKRHGSPMGQTGDPDLYGVWRGIPFEIELKIPGASPTPLQQHRLDQWRKAGARAFVVHDLDELTDALNQLRQQ